MAHQLWNEKKRAHAQKLIDWLMEQRSENGWPVTFQSDVVFSELIFSSKSTDLDQSLAIQVLSEMHSSGVSSIADFERIFENLRRKRAKERQGKNDSWDFLIPMDMTLDPNLPEPAELRVLEYDFSFRRLTSIKSNLCEEDRDRLADSRTLSLFTMTQVESCPEVFIVVSGQGHSWETAWDATAPAFDVLRGIVEFSLSYAQWSMTFGGRKTARSNIPHPLWMMARRPSEPVEWVHFLGTRPPTPTAWQLGNRRYNLTAQDLATLKAGFHFLEDEPEPKSTLSLIADCLRLYAQAMDAQYKYASFLGFWQVAEAITRSDTFGGNTRELTNRLAWFAEKIDPLGTGYKDTLSKFASKRNEIAHQGMRNADDTDINILKITCDYALYWLISVREQLPRQVHLCWFYSLRTRSQAEYQAIQECIRYLESE